MTDRIAPPSRRAFPHFVDLTTRWADNDSYGHVNNVVYYSFFDTAVNAHLIEQGVLDIRNSPVVGWVVETQCRFFAPIAFPDRVTVGLAVQHLGSSSVRYEVGLFANDDPLAAALGTFVHVYVDRTTNRPAPIPPEIRRALAPLAARLVEPA